MTDDRLDALCALLAQPDPADLPSRGHRVTAPADPAAQRQALDRALAVYLAARALAREEATA